jgi:integrase
LLSVFVTKPNQHKSTPQAIDGRAIVLGEACSGGPSNGDYESMARRRYQKPSPRKEGKLWVLYYWGDEFVKGERRRKKKRHVLGPAKMGVPEVQKIRDEFLRPLNQGLVSIGSATKFDDFVESVYKPVVLPTMAKSTRDRYMSIYKTHLNPVLGEMALRDISHLMAQRFVSSMAGWKQGQESRDKAKDVASSIMGFAVEYGLVVKNPFEGVRLPAAKCGRRNKPYITEEVLGQLVVIIPEPYGTLVYAAFYTGLRPSELCGLRRRNLGDNWIRVEERYCRGDWGAPKSESSNATVPVNRAVIERIRRLDTLIIEVKAGRAVRRYPAVKLRGPSDLVFQSPETGGPINVSNVLARHLKPAAIELGIPWVNFQTLRRSFATLLKTKGADVKDAQGLMRHSRASTTLDVYQQHVVESQRRVVDRLVN